MLTPSCPVSSVQCQCFLLALITVLVSLGISVAVSPCQLVLECPPQSRYKSLIAAITSIQKKKIPAYITPFVDAITLMEIY
ncbi:unnamed protein product [Staurois parvus]|uniref:Uncharacterized protein n=1 Tax=Staurois parvus TaxID=386267 RepID=A0ABN9DS27_9NEOB|nr:unnamed protein product [Staurois parvus]